MPGSQKGGFRAPLFRRFLSLLGWAASAVEPPSFSGEPQASVPSAQSTPLGEKAGARILEGKRRDLNASNASLEILQFACGQRSFTTVTHILSHSSKRHSP